MEGEVVRPLVRCDEDGSIGLRELVAPFAHIIAMKITAKQLREQNPNEYDMRVGQLMAATSTNPDDISGIMQTISMTEEKLDAERAISFRSGGDDSSTKLRARPGLASGSSYMHTRADRLPCLSSGCCCGFVRLPHAEIAAAAERLHLMASRISCTWFWRARH